MKNRELGFLGIAMMAGTGIMTALLLYFGDYYMGDVLSGNPNSAILGFLIPAIGLLIGAFAYPIAGHLSDKTSTRFGRRRPYFFFAIPCAVGFALATFPAWIRPWFNFSATTNYIGGYIFILCSYILLIVSWRMAHCPFLALFVDVTEPDERVKASVFLNFCDLGGVMLGFFLPLLFNLEIAAYLMGAFYVVGFMGAFFLGPKEKLELNETPKETKPGILASMKEILGVKILRNYIIGAFFFVFCFNLAFQVLMPYLEGFGLTAGDLIVYAIPLMMILGIFLILFDIFLIEYYGIFMIPPLSLLGFVVIVLGLKEKIQNFFKKDELSKWVEYKSALNSMISVFFISFNRKSITTYRPSKTIYSTIKNTCGAWYSLAIVYITRDAATTLNIETGLTSVLNL